MNSRPQSSAHRGYLPHDLLWGFTPEHLPQDAPAWTVDALLGEPPVVVRRAQGAADLIAVGLRGQSRDQRFASWMPLSAVQHCVQPEHLVSAPPTGVQVQPEWPLFNALAQLTGPLNHMGLPWGITGSLGFELASGIAVTHPASDLDLLVRTAQPMSRAQARGLLALLDQAPGTVDVQLQCPMGAVALREWAGSSPKVMLKTQHQALLVDDPWAPEPVAT